ncbi:MAG: acetate--CoA ligase family protein [Candidatus Kariarchaeaceae archaeon]
MTSQGAVQTTKITDLSPFFTAKTVAVVGASNSKGKVGYDVVHNLKQFGYPGTIVPINRKSKEVQGIASYASLSDYPGTIEVVFVAIPAKFVNALIEEMAKLGIMYVVIISAGFKEVGSEGAKLEKQLKEQLIKYGIRAIGPNCVGLLDAHTPLNGSFASRMPVKGNLGFLSQSGALITGILDWSLNENLGFSKFVSMGNKTDVDEVDLIAELGRDDNTHAILAYIESINNGPAFIEVCSDISAIKPIIVIKSGSSVAGARAASSHTGSMAGTNTAYDAAFAKAGVMRAESVQDLFDFATAISSQPLPRGPNVCIITNAGGPGIIATDASEHAGLTLAELTTETMEYLQSQLHPAASVYNPIDVLGTGTAHEYSLSLRAALQDANVDMVLIIMTPQGMTEPEITAEKIIDLHSEYPSKPIVAAYMGGVDLEEGATLLKSNKIPCFSFPERGIQSLVGLWDYSKIKSAKSLPKTKKERYDADIETVSSIFNTAIDQGRVTLLGSETSQVAKAYGILSPDTRTAFSVNEAIAMANEIGYPVAMKLSSPEIVHKTDIGGIALNVSSDEDVRTNFNEMMQSGREYAPGSRLMGIEIQQMSKKGRELIIGLSEDPQFGHLIMIGAGGIYANYQQDVSFGLAPLTYEEAKAMLSSTRIHRIMQGVRGELPDDIERTLETLLRISQLVTDFPEILELDINPLFVFKDGVNALDVKITLSKERVLKRRNTT